MPIITLPDGSQRVFENPVSVREVAAAIGPGLAKAALAGKVDGRLVDTSHLIAEDVTLALITERDPEGLEIIRHSSAHLLAHAVKQLYPTAQVTIGPVIENGFYYDFAFERPFTPDDLTRIQARMEELAGRDIPISRSVMARDEAVAFSAASARSTRRRSSLTFRRIKRCLCIGRMISSISVAARTSPRPASSKPSG